MRAFAVIGPSQSGKSTLIEGLAALDGRKPRSLEMMGGSRITEFEFMGDGWAALDVPGGQDSFSTAGPILAACDAAVLCVSAETDAAVLAAPYLRLLEESGIPTFLFINRIDAATDRVADIVAALQPYCAHTIVLRQVPMRADGNIVGAIDLISERAWRYQEGERSLLVELPEDMLPREEEARSNLLETLADFDDALLEQIIEDQNPGQNEVYEIATRAVQGHEFVPALLGSAEHGNGILRMMKSLRHEVPDCAASCERLGLPGDTLAISCLADHQKHLGKTVLVRNMGSALAPGCRLGGGTVSGLNEIDARSAMTSFDTGTFALSIKSDHLAVGHAYTPDETLALPEWSDARPPSIRRLVEPVNERDEGKLASTLTRLAEIDIGLKLFQDETTGLLDAGFQGPQHLKRITEKLLDVFSIEVQCREVPTAYRETIRKKVEQHYRHRKQSGGAGQFADVLIDVARRPSGSGFEFTEVVKGGTVPRNYIPAVESGARDALSEGPEGHPVVDVSVTLKDGKAHSVDSSDFAFRTAGRSAVNAALAEAGTIVLQPILSVRVHVPSIFTGELVQVVSGLKGQVAGFDAHPSAAGWDVFNLSLPMASKEALARALSSATRGTAWFISELDHYEEMREPVPA